MKRISSILLLIIICLNHLSIIETVWPLSAKLKGEQFQKTKDSPADKDAETEKEAKEKAGEEDKFCQLDDLDQALATGLPGGKHHLFYNARRHSHPYQDSDTEPPKPA